MRDEGEREGGANQWSQVSSLVGSLDFMSPCFVDLINLEI